MSNFHKYRRKEGSGAGQIKDVHKDVQFIGIVCEFEIYKYYPVRGKVDLNEYHISIWDMDDMKVDKNQ